MPCCARGRAAGGVPLCGAVHRVGRYADFYAGNVTATEHLLEAARRHGAQRFIFVSTPSVYFDYTDRFDVGEDSELPPASLMIMPALSIWRKSGCAKR